MLRTACYVRVSTDKDEQKDSLQNQQNQFLQFIKGTELVLHDFYVDIESGTKEGRENFLRMLADAESGEVQVIVAKELTRFARNGQIAYKMKNLAQKNKVRIITMDGRVDTNDADKMGMFGLYAWLAEEEAERTSKRTKQAFISKMKNGLFIGSVPPYGYYVKDKVLYVRDDNTPEVVKQIFEKYLCGWGQHKIARWLDKEGYPTPAQVIGKKNAGKFWQETTVMKIIVNEAYIGNLVQRKETTTSAVNHERIQVKVSDQIKVENTHEAIIDKDTFYQVQQIYQAKVDAGVGKFKGTKHLFTNVVHCEKCGKSLWYRQNREGYICGTYAKYGVKECSEHAIKEKDLENAILQDLKQFSIKLNSKDIISSMNKKVNKQKENSSIKTKNCYCSHPIQE